MRVTATFNPDRAGIDRLVRDHNGAVGQAMTRLLNRVVNNAKSRANVDTGLMRSRIVFRLEDTASGLLGVVAAQTRYAYFVHEGANGYAGNPFLTDALRDEMAFL